MTAEDSACCAASRNKDSIKNPENPPLSTPPAGKNDDRTEHMVRLEGGPFKMGTDSDIGFPEDGEQPVREVELDPFYIDKFAVTNAHFIEFIRDTGYRTDAERFGWSFVFRDFVDDRDRENIIRRAAEAPWWVAVDGANWVHPYGPSSHIAEDELLDHPVTHISHRDAVAYANWAGKRLPTEAEWEFAARGGLTQQRFPWGDELKPNGKHRCNIWQGEFPEKNTGEDGYLGTAPVNEYDANGYGLYNVAGNVWEWCRDWFSPEYHTTNVYDHTNPTGPDEGKMRVMRGGSYLCHRSWCNRYRVAARSKNSPDSSTGNIGFRCVVDPAGTS